MNTLRRFVPVVARTAGVAWVLLGATQVAAAEYQLARFTPTQATVAKLEQRISLPKGAKALQSYRRTYSGAIIEGRRKILGFYAAGGGIRIIPDTEELPYVFDGGCAFIDVTYDVDAETVEHAFCHGVA